MSIKLIATDLDGTLMSPDHQTITPRTLKALRTASDMGVKLAIATGRPLALIDNVLAQIPFTDYVIYANGACVYDIAEDKTIVRNFIPNDKARDVIAYFLQQEVFFEVYVDGRSQYEFGREEYFDKGDFPQSFIEEAMATMDGHESLLDYLGDREIEKITLYCVKDKDYDRFKAKLESAGLLAVTSFKGNLEATAHTASKGVALKGLSDAMGITSEQVMSFGDAGNDLPMLEFAGYSFAMGNATDECKAGARYVTATNGEDGLAIAVEEYVLKQFTI